MQAQVLKLFPLGTPLPTFHMCIPFHEQLAYIGFHSQVDAVALVLFIDPNKLKGTPLRIADSVVEVLQGVIAKEEPVEKLDLKATTLFGCGRSDNGQTKNRISRAIFSVLAGEKVVMVGNEAACRSCIGAVTQVLPAAIMSQMKIITHTDHNMANWHIAGIPGKDDSIEELNALVAKLGAVRHTVVNAETGEVFSNRDCPAAKYINTCLLDGNLAEARQTADRLWQMSSLVEGEQSVGKIAKNLHITRPDAELLIAIAKNWRTASSQK